MKKIKLFIIQIFLFSCLIISNSFSKALPPGSGVADVPANVLILLDKSGSMGATSYSGANIGAPFTVTPISNTGNYIVHNGNELIGVDHSGNSLTSIVQTTSKYRYRGRGNSCSTYYDVGQNVLYHNNHIYFTGKYYYHTAPRLCKVNTTTGTVTGITSFTNRNAYIGLQKHNDIIIAIDNYDRKIYLHNSATNQTVTCSTSGKLNTVIRSSRRNNKTMFTVDASGNLVFIYNNRIIKFSRSGMNCPMNSHSYTNNYYVSGYPFSMAAHPTNDNIIYVLFRNELKKFTFGANNSSSATVESVGRYGRVNANTYNPTSKSAIRFSYARDIRIDSALYSIFVADYSLRMVQTFDLILFYDGHSGYSSRQSRMAGAHEAIQSLVTDSSLVSL